mmetsp:Transcript_7639/g.28120  ORF Transcript_7639/g.28120 Transcript_7639/m.28120 type:complete len:461 (+) Transcript_7639:264-1646(+)
MSENEHLESPLNSWEDMDKELQSLPKLKAAPPPPPAEKRDPSPHSERCSPRGRTSLSPSASTEDLAPLADNLVSQGRLEVFLKERLEGPQERVMILRLEMEILKFVGNPSLRQLTLPANMSSYQRKCITHVAEYYKLRAVSTQDAEGKYRTSFFKTKVHSGEDRSGEGLPSIRLSQIRVARDTVHTADGGERGSVRDVSSNGGALLVRGIMKRPQSCGKEAGAGSKAVDVGKQRTAEQRQADYERSRARIFGSASEGDINNGRSSHSPAACTSAGSTSRSSTNLDEHGGNLSRSNSSGGLNRSTSRGKAGAIFRDREREAQDPEFQRGIVMPRGVYPPGPTASYLPPPPSPGPMPSMVRHGAYMDQAVPSPYHMHGQQPMVYLGQQPRNAYELWPPTQGHVYHQSQPLPPYHQPPLPRTDNPYQHYPYTGLPQQHVPQSHASGSGQSQPYGAQDFPPLGK